MPRGRSTRYTLESGRLHGACNLNTASVRFEGMGDAQPEPHWCGDGASSAQEWKMAGVSSEATAVQRRRAIGYASGCDLMARSTSKWLGDADLGGRVYGTEVAAV